MSNKVNPGMNSHFSVIDHEGNEVLCEILLTTENEDTGKKYIVFYPIESKADEDGRIELMAASYTEGEDGTGDLNQIETDEEWEFIEEAIEAYTNMEEEHHCHCGCEGHDCHDGDCECDGHGCHEDNCECDDEDEEEDHHCCCGHCHHE